MRRENLPSGDHDKVIWKRNRDHMAETRRQENVTSRRGGDVPLTRLDDVPLTRRWVFHMRLV